MTQFEKDPHSKLDYAFNWAEWLDDEDRIISSSWSVERDNDFSVDEENGLKVSNTPSPVLGDNGYRTSAWLEGGRERCRYVVTNRIETEEGRIEERSFEVYVDDQ
jgi:hypothetical protein